MITDKGPLDGVRVLDFTRVLSGPYATMILGDLGAEVIKIESLEKGDETRNFPPYVGDLSHYFIALNRNKSSITLDLKTPEGAKIAKDLAATSDVVIENFRPGVMDKLGLGYEELKKDNPALVYCAISGFGAEGPLKDKPSFDIVAQALSGIMSVNREPDQSPTKLGVPLGDMSGGIFGVFGILAALHEATTKKVGRKVDISMLDSLLGMLGYLSQLYFVTGKTPEPYGTRHPNIVPYGAIETADGHIIVACLTEGFWRNFANAMGRADLLEDPRYAAYEDRLANREGLEALITEIFKTDTTAAWTQKMEEFDVPHAPILSIAEALDHPNTAARGMIQTVTHPEIGPLKMVSNPVKFVGHTPPEPTPPPKLGENTNTVLSDLLGYTTDEINSLKTKGVIS
ncbi:CaiB/BaiF CoA transferase family protein [Sneathiella limimaris]|uniref:CaiB/BaiF CoA transferase family protein n=1 Tax=Sneathiella limimaris TaxID=1964213 RepID=UPI00146E043A|nr:CaiB/BaiF CoA-transferase family protein [Sneathiella limimaris]